MDNQRLPVRVLAASLPIVVIAVIFGAIGYVTKEPERTQIPALAPAQAQTQAVQGEIVSFEDDRLVLVTESDETVEYALADNATVEALEPITLGDIQLGDWLNGGAIPHPDTVLALINLILLPEPEAP